MWEEEELNGDIIKSTCGYILDLTCVTILENSCAQILNENTCDSCVDDSLVFCNNALNVCDNTCLDFWEGDSLDFCDNDFVNSRGDCGDWDDVSFYSCEDVFNDCDDFDWGKEKMLEGDKGGAMQIGEVVSFGNLIEGELSGNTLVKVKRGNEEVFVQKCAFTDKPIEGGEMEMKKKIQSVFEGLITIHAIVLWLIIRMILTIVVLEFEGARHLWAFLNSKVDETHGMVPNLVFCWMTSIASSQGR